MNLAHCVRLRHCVRVRRRKIKGLQRHHHSSEISCSIPQQAFRDVVLDAEQAQERDSSRYTVLVTSYRKRLLDEDNLCEKYHVDGLRYCGILPSDSARRTKIRVFQIQIRGNEEEKTVIHIIPPHEKKTPPELVPLQGLQGKE